MICILRVDPLPQKALIQATILRALPKVADLGRAGDLLLERADVDVVVVGYGRSVGVVFLGGFQGRFFGGLGSFEGVRVVLVGVRVPSKIFFDTIIAPRECDRWR